MAREAKYPEPSPDLLRVNVGEEEQKLSYASDTGSEALIAILKLILL